MGVCHHLVFFQGILKALDLSFVELVCMSLQKHPQGYFELQVKLIQDSKIKMIKNLNSITYIKIFTSILITIVNSNSSSTNSDVKSNSEISWLERHLRSILLNHHLSFKESTLWCTRINLFWFCNQN